MSKGNSKIISEEELDKWVSEPNGVYDTNKIIKKNRSYNPIFGDYPNGDNVSTTL